MSKAWTILLALTFARMTMGFQFQSIPALALPLTASGQMSFVMLGTLTGAYLLPGAVVALAGGWLGSKVGDARVAMNGLALMALGGFAGWWVTSFETSLFWRLIAGVGAVALNVMVTKMAADWFESRSDLPSAMGVLVSSWPAGIALAALSLPIVAAATSLNTALLVPAVLCALGWFAVWLIWREPARAGGKEITEMRRRFLPRELLLVVIAGGIWALYNVALVSAIAWMPGLLEDRGMNSLSATTSTSLIGWAAIFSVAAGGWLASRLASKDLPTLACFSISAVIVAGLPFLGVYAGSPWIMGLLGLAVGPAAAMIMTLPVEAARPELRAKTMGMYFAIYYALMGVGPVVMGTLRDVTNNSAAPLFASGALLLISLMLWITFRIIQASVKPVTH